MLALLLLLGLVGGPPEPLPTQAAPLDFDSEVVVLRVVRDSIEVEGTYRFVCSPTGAAASPLLYPYPVDSLLGGARTVSLAARVPRGDWRPLAFVESVGYPAAVWTVPLDWGDTLEVRTVYRQRRLASYARYIVTTTNRWRHPLRHARFEIRLPPGARPTRFSFPFQERRIGERIDYVYEAVDFLPDRDIVVEWRP